MSLKFSDNLNESGNELGVKFGNRQASEATPLAFPSTAYVLARTACVPFDPLATDRSPFSKNRSTHPAHRAPASDRQGGGAITLAFA
jgi:hypothetical protein